MTEATVATPANIVPIARYEAILQVLSGYVNENIEMKIQISMMQKAAQQPAPQTETRSQE